jgi:two-component system, OmpR family, sensor kinase
MTLASRLSIFSLAALAVVLAGFSTALHVAARVHSDRSDGQRLGATLAMLAALVEDEPGGLDWEAEGRREVIAQEPGLEGVRWSVRDGRGEVIDRSPTRRPGELPEAPGARQLDAGGHPWRVARRVLRSSRLGGRAPDPGRSAEVVLTAGLRLGHSDAELSNLALALAVLSGAVWLAAALVGRGLCRRALAPLSRMAASARDLDAADPGRRLPVAATGDELEDLGHAFNGLLDRWHEALDRQSRFAGDASHQLRTPLTAVLGQVEVALRRDRPPEEYRRVLGLVRDQSDQLRRIVEALLFLARSEPDAPWPALEVFDLAAWADDQIRRRAELGRGDVVRRREPADPDSASPLLVRAHPALLAQVLDNLLDNARQYADPGSPVDLRVAREGDLVACSVEDRGCGIAPADLARLFEPFHRSAEARRRNRAGAGLGLAVARRIARAFGGELSAESEVGRGSRFVFRLPSAGPPEGGGLPALSAIQWPFPDEPTPTIPTRRSEY